MTCISMVRHMRPGDRFYLLRTMEKFIYVGRRATEFGGMGHFVSRESDGRTTTLHHSCHVKRIVRAA